MTSQFMVPTILLMLFFESCKPKAKIIYENQTEEVGQNPGKKNIVPDPSQKSIAFSDTVGPFRYIFKKVSLQGKELFLVQGDLLMDSLELAHYLQFKKERYQETLKKKSRDKKEKDHYLTGVKVNDIPVKWDKKTIRYCIDEKSIARSKFPDQFGYIQFTILRAEIEWEHASGFDFEYVAAKNYLEKLSPSDGIDFMVKFYNEAPNAPFICAAFLPNEPLASRILWISASFFDTRYYRTGVIAHEFGHIMGFRHEHVDIQAPSECGYEKVDGAFRITEKYDSKSIMHYACGNAGQYNLALSADDQAGALLYYPK